MVTPPPAPTYSREALLDWVRHNAPDLRIGRALINGKLAFFARFTWAGEEHELEALGEQPDEEIARLAAERLRAVMGLPPLFAPDRRSELEARIVRAALAGDEAGRDFDTRRLLEENGRNPRALAAQTRITKREIW